MATINKVQVDGVTYDLEVNASNIAGTVDTATSATKLGTTTVGTTKKPVYFSAGKPVEIGYTIEKSVPSDAVFKYSVFGKSGSGAKEGLVPAPSTTAGTTKYLREDGTWVTPPDTNTVYTHPSYTARTGKPTANQTPAFGGTATVSQIKSDATGHVTAATDRTITIPSTLSNGTGTAGLIKTSSTVTSNSGYTACPVISGVPYYKDTNTTYSVATQSANGLMSAADKKKVDGLGTQVTYSLSGTTLTITTK